MTEWKTLEIAQGTAVSGSAKCLRASTTPRPEFCMPTSIDTVRATASSKRANRATPSECSAVKGLLASTMREKIVASCLSASSIQRVSGARKPAETRCVAWARTAPAERLRFGPRASGTMQ